MVVYLANAWPEFLPETECKGELFQKVHTKETDCSPRGRACTKRNLFFASIGFPNPTRTLSCKPFGERICLQTNGIYISCAVMWIKLWLMKGGGKGGGDPSSYDALKNVHCWMSFHSFIPIPGWWKKKKKKSPQCNHVCRQIDDRHRRSSDPLWEVCDRWWVAELNLLVNRTGSGST